MTIYTLSQTYPREASSYPKASVEKWPGFNLLNTTYF